MDIAALRVGDTWRRGSMEKGQREEDPGTQMDCNVFGGHDGDGASPQVERSWPRWGQVWEKGLGLQQTSVDGGWVGNRGAHPLFSWGRCNSW